MSSNNQELELIVINCFSRKQALHKQVRVVALNRVKADALDHVTGDFAKINKRKFSVVKSELNAEIND